jgi:hypothetical protein
LPVEFIIRTSELRDITKQLKANREEHNDSDSVDILVSESLATFRSIGTEVAAPVDGKSPGSARIPLRFVDRINRAVKTFKTQELAFQCLPGSIKVGTFSITHAEIEVGVAGKKRLALPVDLPLLDALALEQILSPAQIIREGLRLRIVKAKDSRARSVADAQAALEPLGATEKELQNLVDAHVKNAAEKLRRSLKIQLAGQPSQPPISPGTGSDTLARRPVT